MANYIVGDIQGCLSGLKKLLKKVSFDPQSDKLWAVGDLVARGPDSLDTLRYLYSLGPAFDTVLGNHDLHFLAIMENIKAPKQSDFLSPLLRSDDAVELANWLRTKPLAVKIDHQTLLSHAGLYPRWSFNKAIKLSNEVSAQLTGAHWRNVLKSMYGSEPVAWSKKLEGEPRWRFIINAFTRMRYIKHSTDLEFATKTAPPKGPSSLKPWFTVPNEKINKDQKVLFGHWATLMGKTESSQFIGLDTGYVWGNKMTLYCLESKKKIQVQNKEN